MGTNSRKRTHRRARAPGRARPLAPAPAARSARGCAARVGARGPPPERHAAACEPRARRRSGGLAPAGSRRVRAAARRGLSRRARGLGNVRRGCRGAAAAPVGDPRARAPAFDFFPGHPDLVTFPRRSWLRAMRDALREASAASARLPRRARRAGAAAGARRAPAARARSGCRPAPIVVCAGAAQGFALLAQAIGGGAHRGRGPRAAAAPRDPRSSERRWSRFRSTRRGRACRSSPPDGTASGAIDAVLVTPAHQSPTGVALAPARRTTLLEWAAEPGDW